MTRFPCGAHAVYARACSWQVDEAARALQASGYTFDVAYSSMLKRAVETTWLLLKERHLRSTCLSPGPGPGPGPSPSPSPSPNQELNLIHVPVYKDPKLNDRSYGALTGHSVAEFQQAYGAETVQPCRHSQP